MSNLLYPQETSAVENRGASASRAHGFTRDGSPELENRLNDLCQQIRSATLKLVPESRLEALVLGGGYGRGQGGVLRTSEGDCPYNDLEFYVFLRGNPILNGAKYRNGFDRLAEELSPGAGLHVEFKIDSLEKLRRGPVTIFSYDLVSGHRVVYGDDWVFDGCEHHRDSARIIATEPTRLLLNRCSGLLLAKELLLGSSLTSAQADFVGRNLAKAKLAIGDALLAATGRYHWDCLERARRLQQLTGDAVVPSGSQILKLHAEGVRFKLHPTRLSQPLDEFKKEQRTLTELALQIWLWIENRRLDAQFLTLQEYSFSSILKCAGSGAWRNFVLNLRTFGAGAALDRNAARYPRERLFNALPLLLLGQDKATDTAITRQLQRQLRTRAEDWHGLVAAYKNLWNCYG